MRHHAQAPRPRLPRHLAIFGVLVAPCLAFASGAQPEGAVCFYEHVDYQGASFCANADSGWIGQAWNDRVSSVRIRDGVTLQMYKDINYTGSMLSLKADASNFVSLGFNDVLSSFRVQAAPPKNVDIAQVELAQTHVIAPEGRALQSAHDQQTGTVHRLTLIAGRPALLMVKPAAKAAKIQVRARLADGSVQGPVTLNVPSALPATDAGRAPYATDKWSVLLPGSWVQVGATLEIGQSDFATPKSVPLTVTPATSLALKSMPLYLWGARASASVVPDFTLHARNTNGYPLDQEYLQKLPLQAFSQSVGAVMTLDEVVVPPRNDAQQCHPALATKTLDDFHAIDADMNGVLLNVLADFHGDAANRDGSLPTTYYGYMQTWDGSRQQQANSGGGLTWTGAGSSISGGDYRPDIVYAAIFNHEVGHAYGLGHADSDYDQGLYPYELGTKSGSSWGYDANKNQLLSTAQIAGQSCDSRVVDGTCYQRTPMSGGDTDLDARTYRWTTFADYQAAIEQEWFLGKAVRDDAYAGGYKKWNASTKAFEALDGRTRAAIGTDVLKTNQQVQTVYGSISHFNASPSATAIFVTPAYGGNLGRQIDPTVQADLDTVTATTPGGWYGYYCLDRGCDYTLLATFADGSTQRVLVPTGYHQSGYGSVTGDGVRASARDPLNEDNLSRFAVNFTSAHGGIARVQLFNTPHTSQWQAHFTAFAPGDLGTGTYPQVAQWTTADGSSGGAGAPGRTSFNASACQAGAKVTMPVR